MNAAGDPTPDDGRVRRPVAWIGGAVAVIAAIAFAWDGAPNPDGGAASLAMPALPSLPDPAAPSPAAANRETDLLLPSTGASGTELIEVCGVGWVPPDASGGPDLAAIHADADIGKSQRALLDALRRKNGEVGEAMATVLELQGAGRDSASGTPFQALVRCLGAASSPALAAECAARVEERQRAATLVERLAKLAAASSEPRVYALAMQQCQPMKEQGSCALLNADQWARVDDGNALPWLHVLERARDRNDPAQIEEALHHIGAAARFEDASYAIAGRVADLAGTGDVDAIGALLVAVDALAFGVSRVDPYVALINVCKSPSLVDANRRQECEHAAETLADRSDSPAAVRIGAELGRRVGWPADRVDALRRLASSGPAMDEANSATSGLRELPNSCSGARRILASFSRKARDGEVQTLRAWLASRGDPAAFAARPPTQPAPAQTDDALARSEPAAAQVAAERASEPAAASAAVAIAAATSSSAEPAASSAAAAPSPGASASATPYSATPPPDR